MQVKGYRFRTAGVLQMGYGKPLKFAARRGSALLIFTSTNKREICIHIMIMITVIKSHTSEYKLNTGGPEFPLQIL